MIPFPTRVGIADGVMLHYIRTRRFSDNLLSFHLLTELDRKTAPADTLLPSVLLRGSTGLPDTASISRRLDMLYDGDVEYSTSYVGNLQTLSFSFSFLDDSFVNGTDLTSGCFEMARELLFSPLVFGNGFSPAFTAQEKKHLLDRIRSQKNNKASYSIRRALHFALKGASLCKDGWGSESGVKKQTPQSLLERYRFLLSSAPFDIFYFGRLSLDSVLMRLSPLFDFPRSPVSLRLTQMHIPAHSVHTVTEEGDQEQSHLVLCFRTSSTYFNRLSARSSFFVTVFGGNPQGKLFRNLREKKSLCYYCDVLTYPAFGVVLVYCGIDADKKEDATSEILLQLDHMKKGQITRNELIEAKRFYEASFSAMPDSASAMEEWYYTSVLTGREEDRPEQTLAKIRSFGVGDLMAEAQAWRLDTIYFLKGSK